LWLISASPALGCLALGWFSNLMILARFGIKTRFPTDREEGWEEHKRGSVISEKTPSHNYQ
jgi:hypothetical protein